MVKRSVTLAKWDEDRLAIESQQLQGLDLDLCLTGFDPARSTNRDDEDQAQRDTPLGLYSRFAV
jgi:hypothetical protein